MFLSDEEDAFFSTVSVSCGDFDDDCDAFLGAIATLFDDIMYVYCRDCI